MKRILRYLQGTKTIGLAYHRVKDVKPLIGYADADCGNDVDDRHSISGCVFTVFGNLVSWTTKKQSMVVLSSTEAELIALCAAAKEDNIPCVKIAEEPRNHQRTKHIDIRYMYIRELIRDQKVVLVYLKSEEQIADIFTKSLGPQKFHHMLHLLKLKK